MCKSKIKFRSQFEKSENAGNNTIKTTTDTDVSNIDISQINVNHDAGVPAFEPSTVTKVNETTSRFSVKKPSTPKPTTPREKFLSTSEAKSKESKEKEAHSKGIKVQCVCSVAFI